MHRHVVRAMLLVWLPATMLCYAESGGVLARDHCCAPSSSEYPVTDHSGAAPCCVVASGNYKPNDAGRSVVAQPARELLVVAELPDPAAALNGHDASLWVVRIPQVGPSRTFFIRAALPVRAPPFSS